jgi:pimeloyl-ACP methyl ester carboxylesterase
MHIDKNIILNRTGKKPILVDVFYPDNTVIKPIIIFCHGYKGFKDWGAWHLMAETLAGSGFCFIKFNFSHNGGTIENPIDFSDLDAFGNNNYTKEINDLDDVISWVQNTFKNYPYINTNEIYLIGHSRGGGITILQASEDNRVKKLITLAGVSDFGKRMVNSKEWKEKGVQYVHNGRTKQQMPHFYQFYEDFKDNEERLHIESAEKRLRIPHLIIHGDADTSVLIDEAKALHQWNPKSHLQIIQGADHVFNTKHPWVKSNLSIELETVVNLCITFLSK